MDGNRDRGRRIDPTRVLDQPSLRQSTGRIWIVMGGLFLVIALIPFVMLAYAGSGRSAPVAFAAGALLVGLYAALIIVRLTVGAGRMRLRLMAACMLTMACTGLLGAILCAVIERGAL